MQSGIAECPNLGCPLWRTMTDWEAFLRRSCEIRSCGGSLKASVSLSLREKNRSSSRCIYSRLLAFARPGSGRPLFHRASTHMSRGERPEEPHKHGSISQWGRDKLPSRWGAASLRWPQGARPPPCRSSSPPRCYLCWIFLWCCRNTKPLEYRIHTGTEWTAHIHIRTDS